MTLHDEPHDDFGGLQRDLPKLLNRRQMLQWLGGASLATVLAACGLDDAGTTTTTVRPGTTAVTTTTRMSTEAPGTTAAPRGATTTTAAAQGTTTTQALVQASAGAEIPDETAGPFPANGSNGPNLLSEAAVLRRDLTTSFGAATGVAAGVPLTIDLTVVDAASGDPRPGAAVYLWHCTADGRYSVYEVVDQNYLRGMQTTDDAGRLSFATVFPGCYRGRWPHAHFEVYPSLDEATNGAAAIKTSQLALPQADCETVYADPRYGNSASNMNLARLSLATDIVFSDGWQDQLAVVSGSPEERFAAALLVRV